MAATQAPPAELCPSCSAPLGSDQQYCLNCGRRVGAARTDLLAALAGGERLVEQTAVAPLQERPPVPSGPGLWSPLGGAVLAGLAALGVLLGALLWAGDERDIVVNVPRQEAPRVNVSVPAGGAAAVPAEFAGDWPGDDGWTVRLTSLPKDGTQPAQVEAAKAAATSKGAEDVGALDSDEYPSLDPGEYVVYSGVFDSKKAAQKAARRLRDDFDDAKAVKVAAGGNGGGAAKVDKDADKASKSELEDLQNAKGDAFVKKSKKLKDKVATEGKVPKQDDKAPAGGKGGGTVLE